MAINPANSDPIFNQQMQMPGGSQVPGMPPQAQPPGAGGMNMNPFQQQYAAPGTQNPLQVAGMQGVQGVPGIMQPPPTPGQVPMGSRMGGGIRGLGQGLLQGAASGNPYVAAGMGIRGAAQGAAGAPDTTSMWASGQPNSFQAGLQGGGGNASQIPPQGGAEAMGPPPAADLNAPPPGAVPGVESGSPLATPPDMKNKFGLAEAGAVAGTVATGGAGGAAMGATLGSMADGGDSGGGGSSNVDKAIDRRLAEDETVSNVFGSVMGDPESIKDRIPGGGSGSVMANLLTDYGEGNRKEKDVPGKTIDVQAAIPGTPAYYINQDINEIGIRKLPYQMQPAARMAAVVGPAAALIARLAAETAKGMQGKESWIDLAKLGIG